jgi:hypothetical protein
MAQAPPLIGITLSCTAARMDMVANILWVVLIALFFMSAWAAVVCLYWLWSDYVDERFWSRHERLTMAIGIGGFIFACAVLICGFEGVLFFIPRRWGSFDEHGEWTSTRQGLSSVLGFFSALAVTDMYGKVKNLRRDIQHLKAQLRDSEERHSQESLKLMQLLEEYETRDK